jgi:hypothetical protein
MTWRFSIDQIRHSKGLIAKFVILKENGPRVAGRLNLLALFKE